MESIRNIAIIAHVDHGKTTLVDKIIQTCIINNSNKENSELILDNNDLERERGITILSKNISVKYKNVKINIIDTPGHADFGGEVERVLKMADGVLLLVDAFEGIMPQTRFVLQKAIELKLKPILVINKIDKENCQPEIVQESVFDLMFNLNASEDQLNFETIYGSSKQGWMSLDWKSPTNNITILLDTILSHIPQAPNREGITQMQITSLDYSNFKGRIAIGRVFQGKIKKGSEYILCQNNNNNIKVKIKELFEFKGLGKNPIESINSGDICAIVGLDHFEIGDTITSSDEPKALPRIKIDEPTMSMLFTINNSPFFGKEGKFVTSRHLRDRLKKETEKNLALRVEETNSEEKFNVYGRGILHLSILIENLEADTFLTVKPIGSVA